MREIIKEINTNGKFFQNTINEWREIKEMRNRADDRIKE